MNADGTAEGFRAPQTKRHRLSLALLLAALGVMAPLSIDFYLPAVPAMGQQLHASAGMIQMTLGVYMVGSAVGQLLFGPISDRFGRRRPSVFGVIVYIAACIGCALAVNAEAMIAFRFLQALGVCAGLIASRAIMADLFEPKELARFSSMLAMITLGAPVIGPLFGGFIYTAFGWRILFWILAVYGSLVLVLVLTRLPETLSKERQASARAESALNSYLTVARNWPLMRMALAAAFAQSAFGVYLANSAHLLIEHFGIPAYQFGVYFAANSAGLWLGALANRRLLRRAEPQQVLRGTCLAYLAFALMLLVGVHLPGLGRWGVLIPLFCMVATFPTVIGNASALAQAMDRTRAGAVAAMLGALSSGMSALGVAVVALIGGEGPAGMSYVMAGGAAMCVVLFLGARARRLSA